MKQLIVIFSFLFFIAALAVAEEKKTCDCECSGNEAFKVHGRLMAYNGTPSARIWIIGTKRLLGVDQDEDENYNMPDYLKKELRFGVAIYGDFVVCPLEKSRPGWMQRVCIKSASNLVIKKF